MEMATNELVAHAVELRARDLGAAADFLQEALEPETRSVEDRRQIAAALAQTLLLGGRFAAARDLACEWAGGDDRDEAACGLMIHRAAANLHLGELRQALRDGMETEAAASAIGLSELRVGAIVLQGDVLTMLGRFDEARATVERGLSITHGSVHEDSRARLFGALGRMLSRARDFPAAIQAHLDALELHRSGDRPRETALELADVGFACAEMGAFDDAVAYVVEARVVVDSVGDDHLLWNIERTLSWALQNLGEHEGSVTYARGVVEMAERTGGDLLIARAHERLGNALVAAGRHEEAAPSLERTAQVASEADDAWLAVTSLTGLAEVRLAQDDADAAEELLAPAWRLSAAIDDHVLVQALHRVTATLRERRGDFEGALRHEVQHRMLSLESVRRAADARVASLRHRHESEQLERQLRRALESLPEGVLLIGDDETILEANSGACEMFGLSADEIRTQTITDLVPERDRARSAEVVREYLRDPRPLHVSQTLTGRRACGAEFPAEIALGILPARAGIVVLCSVRDVSELRRAESDLRGALDELRALRRQLERDNVALRGELEGRYQFDEIVGSSATIQAVLRNVAKVAPTDATVLVLGETGTGKELFARAVHARSARSGRPLVTVNCAAMPESLIESELFGHVAGAFTGALTDRPGRFQMADAGTIFLDEIGDLPLPMQAKLLRVLQDGEVQRVGAPEVTHVDARVLAATNRDLVAMVADGAFRADLFYRLNVFPLHLPPLRQCTSDIPQLVWFLVQRSARRVGRRIDTVPDEVMQRFVAYDWPGNVRELENVIERAVILSSEGTLTWEGDAVAAPVETTGRRLTQVERRHIVDVLISCEWQVKGAGGAADVLGMNASTLRSRMRKLGIERPRL